MEERPRGRKETRTIREERRWERNEWEDRQKGPTAPTRRRLIRPQRPELGISEGGRIHAWEEERDSIKNQPASGEVGGTGGSKGWAQEEAERTKPPSLSPARWKELRLRNRQRQAQRRRLGEEVGKGTGANEGTRRLEQSSGQRKLKWGLGLRGSESAPALGALLGRSIHPLNTPDISKGACTGSRLRAHSHLPGLFLF